MRRFISIVIIILVSDWGFCQKSEMKSVPVLFDTVKVDVKYKRKRLEIKDSLLSDSLKISFKVTLQFKYPLSDTTKQVVIKSLKLTHLDVKSLTTSKRYSIDSSEKNKWSKYEKNFWFRYSKILNYWYWNQPYEKMIDRRSYGKKAYFGGVLYAM